MIDALDRLHRGPQHYYLNFYGPPGTVTTIPFADLIEGRNLPDLTGRAVFVGVSERGPSNLDTFYTVVSTNDGVDMSGIEIAATAFGNLLEGTSLKVPERPAELGTLIGFGIVIGLLAYLLPGTLAVMATALLATGWLAMASTLFNQSQLWLPVAVPLLVQVPIALFGGLLWQYLTANRERRNVSQAIRYYLPERVAADLARRPINPGNSRDLVYGTCVATDAERFTTLAETMAPTDLANLLDSYFAAMFEPIQSNGGTVTGVVGDGIMSVWTAPHPDRASRLGAALAAFDLTSAVERFNRQSPGRPMPTRIGLHTGWTMVGNVGGKGHFAWSVVGDIPNTASRIEGLNKHLGTRMLASSTVVGDLDELLTRRVGRFRLVGKADAIDIHELLAPRGKATPEQHNLVDRFGEALETCEAGRLAEAAEMFDRILEDFPNDGPARFHLERCRKHTSAEVEWDEFDNQNERADIARLRTMTVPLQIRYFAENGLFARAGANLVGQQVEQRLASFDQTRENFVTVDLSVGFRLPERRGSVSLEVRNLLDEQFLYQDMDSITNATTRPRFIPARSVLGRLSLSF